MIEKVAARMTGRAVTRVHSRGPIAEVLLDDGETVVVKRGHAPGAAAAEAAGLHWLAATGTVRLPRVHGHDTGWLVLDHVPQDRPSPAAAERFGHDLARLHAAGAPAFGAPPPDGPAEAWIGTAPMTNKPAGDWPTWYASSRVLPYVRLAVDAGTYTASDAAVFERACTRFADLSGPPEPPARLHGDLWNGNVLWSAGEAWLIDPAAHGGHRETDLAMLALFGCPHLDRILAAYRETHPLADGWHDRVGLHQLFPLLVHTVLFGQSYAAQALSAARSVG